MEKLINEQIHKQLVDLFNKELVHPVEIILFTSDAHQSSEYGTVIGRSVLCFGFTCFANP